MGLSDKVIGAANDAEVFFSKEEAFFAIAVAVVVEDGDISDQKLEDVIRAIERVEMFQHQSGQDHDAMVEKIFKFLNENGSLALAWKGTEYLPTEMRKTAFAVAAKLLRADDYLGKGKIDWAVQLQTSLGIADQVASKIVGDTKFKKCG